MLFFLKETYNLIYQLWIDRELPSKILIGIGISQTTYINTYSSTFNINLPSFG